MRVSLSLAAAVLLLCASAFGEDKPRPRWELKDKPSVWESSWRNCDDTPQQSSGSVNVDSNALTIVDVIPSPGSFAGRTGHSGATKFIVDTLGKRIDEASEARNASP